MNGFMKIILCLTIMCFAIAKGQNITESPGGGGGGGGDDEDDGSVGSVIYNPALPFCYRFTWLGPEFDVNTEGYNMSCTEYQDEKGCPNGCGVPCRTPFVITNDSTLPDLDALWNDSTYRGYTICQQRKGQSCVKYSYSFDNIVQNITYMCTKVQDLESGRISDGCYQYDTEGYNVELCVCDSTPGMKPCNSAPTTFASLSLLLATVICSYFGLIR